MLMFLDNNPAIVDDGSFLSSNILPNFYITPTWKPKPASYLYPPAYGAAIVI